MRSLNEGELPRFENSRNVETFLKATDIHFGGAEDASFRMSAPPLLEKDNKWGNWVISEKFNAAMLAEAVCKQKGFVYAPSDTIYWQHGHSTERPECSQGKGGCVRAQYRRRAR